MILIAHDEAFNFTYRANIDTLRSMDEVRFFSPLRDKALPPCDWLYMPGGYPELYADQLEVNRTMRDNIRQYAENGGCIFAECGGFMYLCQCIDEHAMCNVLPLRTTMQGARLHLGYRKALWQGKEIRGHEFHYSSVIEESLPNNVEVLRIQQTATGKPIDTPIYRYKNVVASYTHWYWAQNLNDFFGFFLF